MQFDGGARACVCACLSLPRSQTVSTSCPLHVRSTVSGTHTHTHTYTHTHLRITAPSKPGNLGASSRAIVDLPHPEKPPIAKHATRVSFERMDAARSMYVFALQRCVCACVGVCVGVRACACWGGGRCSKANPLCIQVSPDTDGGRERERERKHER